MLDCLIMGDSIAVGMHYVKPQCTVIAKSGINSQQYNEKYVKNHKNAYGAEAVIVSLGSNDAYVKHTYNELYVLREKIKAERVFWVLPNPEKFPTQASDVKLIAVSFGDTVIQTQKYSPDEVHPTNAGYRELSTQVE